MALQLANDAINTMTQAGSDKALTLEAYLVGPDKYLRSNSVLNPDYTVEKTFAEKKSVDTEAVQQALASESR